MCLVFVSDLTSDFNSGGDKVAPVYVLHSGPAEL